MTPEGTVPNPAVAGNRLLESIKVLRLLSFGSALTHLDLQPLNLLIGPNASGKSNLLDVISLLQAAPRDLPAPTRHDGIQEWLWKGDKEARPAEIHVRVHHPDRPAGLTYNLS